MELNGFGSIFVFLVSSYSGLFISILVFCTSIILLIVKHKKLKIIIKLLLLLLVIVSVFLIGSSIYFSIAFGKNNQKSEMDIINGNEQITEVPEMTIEYGPGLDIEIPDDSQIYHGNPEILIDFIKPGAFYWQYYNRHV